MLKSKSINVLLQCIKFLCYLIKRGFSFLEVILNQHLILRTLSQKHNGRALNEADTRANVIDTIIHEVLDWPKSSVKREVSIHPGYADYMLYNTAGKIALVIEAKREGVSFDLPKKAGLTSDNQIRFVSVRTLLTSQNTKDAMIQVRNYCLEIGSNFACVTNGHEWIFLEYSRLVQIGKV